MISTIKTGARRTCLLAKGAWLVTTVWWAGGVVAHARDAYQDRHADAVVDDHVAAADPVSLWQRVRGLVSESMQVVRVRTALVVVFYVIGIVLATELSQASCAAGHTIGCKIAKNIIGGGN
jgi:hypothetical protein